MLGPQTDKYVPQSPFTGQFFQMMTFCFGVNIVNQSMTLPKNPLFTWVMSSIQGRTKNVVFLVSPVVSSNSDGEEDLGNWATGSHRQSAAMHKNVHGPDLFFARIPLKYKPGMQPLSRDNWMVWQLDLKPCLTRNPMGYCPLWGTFEPLSGTRILRIDNKQERQIGSVVRERARERRYRDGLKEEGNVGEI